MRWIFNQKNNGIKNNQNLTFFITGFSVKAACSSEVPSHTSGESNYGKHVIHKQMLFHDEAAQSEIRWGMYVAALNIARAAPTRNPRK